MRGDAQTVTHNGGWLFRRGTVMSWRVQSAWFSGRSVSCIMYGGCYFHHMVLSGVIVVPAPSAQIALCSQIVVLVSTLTLSPSYLLPFFSLFTLFSMYYGNGVRGPSGCYYLVLSLEWCGSWFKEGFRVLSRAGCCDKASPHCQATQENEREKVALLWGPCIISHSKWQPSTQAQMPTDAGVSARGVCVYTALWMCVCVCLFPAYAIATVKACRIQYPSQPNNLD